MTHCKDLLFSRSRWCTSLFVGVRGGGGGGCNICYTLSGHDSNLKGDDDTHTHRRTRARQSAAVCGLYYFVRIYVILKKHTHSRTRRARGNNNNINYRSENVREIRWGGVEREREWEWKGRRATTIRRNLATPRVIVMWNVFWPLFRVLKYAFVF